MEENLVNVAPPESINQFESGSTKNQIFNVLPTSSNTMTSSSIPSNNNYQLTASQQNQQPVQMFQHILLQNQGFKPGQTNTIMQDNSQQQMQQLFHQYLMLQAFQQSGLNMAANRNTFLTTPSTTSTTTTSINTFSSTLNPQLPTSAPIRPNNYNQSSVRMSMIPQPYLNNNNNNNASNNNILLTQLPFQQQQLSLLNQLAQQQKLQPVSSQNSITTSKTFSTPVSNPILLGGFIPQGFPQQQPQSMLALQQLQHLTSQQLKIQQILQQYQPTLPRVNSVSNDNKDASKPVNPSTTKSSSLLSSTFIDTSRNSITPSNLPPSSQLPHTSSPSKNRAQNKLHEKNTNDQHNINNLNNSLSSNFNDKFSLNHNHPEEQQNNQAMENKQVATVKPYNIVTHIIEGFVIQEGPEPFPIQKSLSLNDYYKSDEEERETEEDDDKSNCLTDEEDIDKMNGADKMQANVMVDSNNKLVSENNYDNEASLNSDVLKCAFCGCDFMPKNKTTKFCSISCNRKNAINKRWNSISKGNIANKKSPQKRKSRKGKTMEAQKNFNDFQQNDQVLYYQQPNHFPSHQQQNMHLQSQQLQSNHMQQNQPQQLYSFQQNYNVVTPDLHNQNYQYQNQNYQHQNVNQQQMPQIQHIGQQNHFQSDNIQLQNAYNVHQSQNFQQQPFQATHKYEEPDLVIIGDDKDLIFNRNNKNLKNNHVNINNNMNNSINNEYNQHEDNLSPNVSVTNTDVASWGVADVHSFISKLSGCASYADDFLRQEIDGQALMLLSEDLLMSTLHVKLGPALKICSNIRALRGQHGDNCGV